MRDPYNPFDDRVGGIAMLGSVGFCAVSGLGVGIFLEHPLEGGLAGGAAGIVLGLWLVPGLMRDWRD